MIFSFGFIVCVLISVVQYSFVCECMLSWFTSILYEKKSFYLKFFFAISRTCRIISFNLDHNHKNNRKNNTKNNSEFEESVLGLLAYYF